MGRGTRTPWPGRIPSAMWARSTMSSSPWSIAEIEGVREAQVTLVSMIGSPVSRPIIRSVRLGEDGGLNAGPALESKIEGILDFWLESTDDLVE